MLLLALALAVQAPSGPPPSAPPTEVSPVPSAAPAPASASSPATPEPANAPEPVAPDPAASAPSVPPPYKPVLLGPPPRRPDPELEPAFPPVPLELRPAPPTLRGTGLIVGAAIAGVANIGLSGARLGLLLGEPTVRNENIHFYLTAIAVPLDVAAGVGLAAGAGVVRGRWDGYRSGYDGLPRLRATSYIQTGAVLLAMGAVGYVMAWIPWHGDSSLAIRGGGTLLIETAASLVLMGGTGILAYGYAWRKNAEKHGYSRRLGLRPSLAPNFAGLSFSGQF